MSGATPGQGTVLAITKASWKDREGGCDAMHGPSSKLFVNTGKASVRAVHGLSPQLFRRTGRVPVRGKQWCQIRGCERHQ